MIGDTEREDTERAESLRLGWETLGPILSVETLDEIGKLYMQLCLGLTDEEVEKFLDGDSEIYHRVGLMQGGVIPYEPNLSRFWACVSELTFITFVKHNFTFLADRGGIAGVWVFLFTIDPPRWSALGPRICYRSPILGRLSTNAHVYK